MLREVIDQIRAAVSESIEGGEGKGEQRLIHLMSA